jgi:hypothetical protein
VSKSLRPCRSVDRIPPANRLLLSTLTVTVFALAGIRSRFRMGNRLNRSNRGYSVGFSRIARGDVRSVRGIPNAALTRLLQNGAWMQ